MFFIELVEEKWVSWVIKKKILLLIRMTNSSTINTVPNELTRLFQSWWQTRFADYKLVNKDAERKSYLNDFMTSYILLCQRSISTFQKKQQWKFQTPWKTHFAEIFFMKLGTFSREFKKRKLMLRKTTILIYLAGALIHHCRSF